MLLVTLYAALSYSGIVIGALMAETNLLSDRGLSAALHAAAGLMLAVVGVNLMPPIIGAHPFWIAGVAFLGGGVLSVVASQWTGALETSASSETGQAWMIYFAVATDLVSDGILIGTSAQVGQKLALTIAASMVLGDIPEGISTLGAFRDRGQTPCRRWLLTAALLIPLIVGAAFAFELVRGKDPIIKASLLAFTAAILTKVTVEEMISSAHSVAPHSSLQALAFIAGFTAFLFLSAWLGG